MINGTRIRATTEADGARSYYSPDGKLVALALSDVVERMGAEAIDSEILRWLRAAARPMEFHQ